jgi:molybdopterin biosynthesis enzyme
VKTRPFQHTISLDEARAIIERTVQPIARIERLSLGEARDRVLAGTIVATADVPPFSRAAMDGYAVRADDTAGAGRSTPRTLRCVEEIFTGQMPQRTLAAGECAAVATGAPMPAGADAVVMVEETTADGARIGVLATVQPRQNVGAQGADIRQGQTVLSQGTCLNASRIGAVAALGMTGIDVYARPRVAILSTGNEIVEPGQPLAPGQLYDINRYTLAAVVEEHGGIAVPQRLG